MDVQIPEPSKWFTDAATLAAVVAFLVSTVRKHLWKTLDGPFVVGVSVALGVALSYLGQLLGYQLQTHPIAYGVSAGLMASGFTDYARTLLGKSGGAMTSQGTARGRLQ